MVEARGRPLTKVPPDCDTSNVKSLCLPVAGSNDGGFVIPRRKGIAVSFTYSVAKARSIGIQHAFFGNVNRLLANRVSHRDLHTVPASLTSAKSTPMTNRNGQIRLHKTSRDPWSGTYRPNDAFGHLLACD